MFTIVRKTGLLKRLILWLWQVDCGACLLVFTCSRKKLDSNFRTVCNKKAKWGHIVKATWVLQCFHALQCILTDSLHSRHPPFLRKFTTVKNVAVLYNVTVYHEILLTPCVTYFCFTLLWISTFGFIKLQAIVLNYSDSIYVSIEGAAT